MWGLLISNFEKVWEKFLFKWMKSNKSTVANAKVIIAFLYIYTLSL